MSTRQLKEKETAVIYDPLNATEERLKELEDLVEATIQSKSHFIKNVNHQIRTLSNAIIGFSELLRCDDLSESQLDYAVEIRRTAEALVSAVNNAVDLAKIEAGELSIDTMGCSFGDILDKTHSQVDREANIKGLKFVIQNRSELPSQIRTDPAKLRQCLFNLCNHVIKLTDSGCLYLDVSQEACDNKTFIRFDVYGNCTDISDNGQEGISELFDKADKSQQKNFTSVDICLTLTNELTKLLGGYILEAKKVNSGSVLSLLIPAGVDIRNVPLLEERQSVSGEAAEPKIVVERKSSGRILLVEDEPSNQVVLSLLMESMGLQVSIAADGVEGVKKAFEEEFDLVLMDIQMPRMDGYEALRLLRERGFKSPVIALSASELNNDFKEFGFDQFISKPVDGSKLYEVITQLI